MKLINTTKTFQALLITMLVTAPHLAWGEIKCPKIDAPDRDAKLSEIFTSVKADSWNSATTATQEAIFDCLEGLINSKVASLAGKKPDLQTMKTLVLWSAKSIQYQNDVYSAEFNGILAHKVFGPHEKLVNQALKALEKEKALSAQEIRNFKEIL